MKEEKIKIGWFELSAWGNLLFFLFIIAGLLLIKWLFPFVTQCR
jgi:hypothetical protein